MHILHKWLYFVVINVSNDIAANYIIIDFFCRMMYNRIRTERSFIMNILKRTLAGTAALTLVLSASVSCSNKKSSKTKKSESSSQTPDIQPTEPVTEDPNKMTITWLGDFDLNPDPGEPRSTALALFEDQYGGKINYIRSTPGENLSILDSMIAAGEEVDIFPYYPEYFPQGVIKNRFEPLDPYFDTLEMDSDLWSGMSSVAEAFAYKDQHYVIPYSMSDPLVLTYSRKIMSDNGFEDPYKLYTEGKWDWDTFMAMMEKFVSEPAPDWTPKYGIGGSFGQGVIPSAGKTVVSCENGSLVSNIMSPEIQKAQEFMHSISVKNLYRRDIISCYPTNGCTLFLADNGWSLGQSNASNPDKDIMIVPFPKSKDASAYPFCGSYNARMLVKNSKKGEAVATYIKCERLAASDQKCLESAKKHALQEVKTASGIVRSSMTEEQYNALVSYCDPSKFIPAVEFAYGMGDEMNTMGAYTYETRGVMNNLEMKMLEVNPEDFKWEDMRDKCKAVIEKNLAEYK